MDAADAQITFFRKFAHLYDSGIALTEALDLARADSPKPIHEAIGAVVEDLFRGTSLADALEAWPDHFPTEVVALIRAGEHRGELSGAARAAADGLAGGVLDPDPPDAAAAEALLMAAGDARAIHIGADRSVQRRLANGILEPAEEAGRGATESFRQRAPAFLWENRLVRIESSASHLVVRLSGPPIEEPAAARAWREGPGGVLALVGGHRADFDAALRGVLGAFAGRVCVAVNLPVPEAVAARDFDHALRLDPDVLAVFGEPAFVPPGMHVVVASHTPVADAVATVEI